MRILVINSGSSSIKFSMFEHRGAGGPELVYDGELSGIGGVGARLVVSGAEVQGRDGAVKAADVAEGVGVVLDSVVGVVEAVGYRVVHPGAKLEGHVRVTEQVLRDLEAAAEFAPLHDPGVVEVIRAGMKRFPGVGHYACFDTVFHRTMGMEATTYPVPRVYREQGVRRYGFHGLSCESVVRQMGERVPRRMVIAHLGSGCSVTAVVEGRSVDTTMGLTPTGGVVMGTRPGDLDPGVVFYLLRKNGSDVAVVEKMMNHDCGMVALSGMANDMKEVRWAAGAGNEEAELALRIFTRSVRKAIGGYCWLLGGLEAIVFAGGIGEHDARTRAEVLEGLEAMGVSVDAGLNEATGSGMRRISGNASKVEALVAPAEEDWMIAVHVVEMSASGK